MYLIGDKFPKVYILAIFFCAMQTAIAILPTDTASLPTDLGLVAIDFFMTAVDLRDDGSLPWVEKRGLRRILDKFSLRGVPSVISTDTYAETVDSVLGDLGLRERFSAVYDARNHLMNIPGTAYRIKKIKQICDDFHTHPSRVVMFGDLFTDKMAAKRAGAHFRYIAPHCLDPGLNFEHYLNNSFENKNNEWQSPSSFH